MKREVTMDLVAADIPTQGARCAGKLRATSLNASSKRVFSRLPIPWSWPQFPDPAERTCPIPVSRTPAVRRFAVPASALSEKL